MPRLRGTVWSQRDRTGKLERRISTFAGQGLLIYQGCKQAEAAWKFIEWVMSDTEANVERFTKGNSFPDYTGHSAL